MNDEKLKLLIVEDRDEHFADFEKMLSDQEFPVALDITRAKTLEEAIPLIPQVDGVVSDVFFPYEEGGEEEPNGRRVVEECLKTSKPVVWITSTWHHGSKTNKHNEWGREKFLEMFDCYGMGNPEAEGEHKPWLEAILGIIHSIYAVRFKEWVFTPNGVKTSEPRQLLWPANQAARYLLEGIKLPEEYLAHTHMLKLGFSKFSRKK